MSIQQVWTSILDVQAKLDSLTELLEARFNTLMLILADLTADTDGEEWLATDDVDMDAGSESDTEELVRSSDQETAAQKRRRFDDDSDARF